MAIITPFGLFEYVRLPFGLRNASQTFQHFMDEVTRGLEGVFVYLDDILVASRISKEHEKHLSALFERLQQHGLVISPEKSIFCTDSVEFLGFQISSNGIIPLPTCVDAIVSFPEPKDVRSLQRFIGMVHYYHRFIPNCSSLLTPLYDQLKLTGDRGSKKQPKPSTPIQWSDKLHESFSELKSKIRDAIFLHHPVPGARLAISVDASDIGVGAILEQFVSGVWQPLSFFSKSQDQGQVKYSAFDRELLATKLAI